ncbi:MAG TPA: hypothetical protein VF771_00930 [Longimicrobiaceae bacterium]
MKKLQLDLDALTVSSFATVEQTRAARGTVEAHATAAGQRTCALTCETSCAGGGHCTCYPYP